MVGAALELVREVVAAMLDAPVIAAALLGAVLSVAAAMGRVAIRRVRWRLSKFEQIDSKILEGREALLDSHRRVAKHDAPRTVVTTCQPSRLEVRAFTRLARRAERLTSRHQALLKRRADGPWLGIGAARNGQAARADHAAKLLSPLVARLEHITDSVARSRDCVLLSRHLTELSGAVREAETIVRRAADRRR